MVLWFPEPTDLVNREPVLVETECQELVVVRLAFTDTGVDTGLHQLLLDVARALEALDG